MLLAEPVPAHATLHELIPAVVGFPSKQFLTSEIGTTAPFDGAWKLLRSEETGAPDRDASIRFIQRLTPPQSVYGEASALSYSFEGKIERTLKDHMQQFESRMQDQVKALAIRVEMLAQKIGTAAFSSEPIADTGEVIRIITPELISASKLDGTISEVLNQIADEGVSLPGVSEVAKSSLQALDPATRASAGRALSVTDVDAAKHLLPEAIQKERNGFVRAVLEGALLAAQS